MPRAKIALNGFSQVPDEKGGPPRVARLVNAKLAAPDRIEKSPGTIAMPTTTAPVLTLVPLAYGVTPSQIPFAISRTIPSVQNGARIFSGEHGVSATVWTGADESKQNIVYDEAARTEPVFTSDQYSYNAPGIMDLGDGDYVVTAEGLRSYTGTLGGTFLDSDLQWALVSGGDLKVKARGLLSQGSIGGGTPAGQRIYPVNAGPYLVAWYNLSTIGIYGFQRTAPMGLVLLTTLSLGAPTLTSGSQIDASYDPVLGRLLVVGPTNQFWWINTTTWTVLQSGTLGFAPVAGTVGCSVESTITPGYAYFVYRATGARWDFTTYVFTDSSTTVSVAPTPIYTSLVTLAGGSPTFVPWRAGVKAWANAGWLRPEGAMVTVYHEPTSTDTPICTSVTLAIRNNGTIDRTCYHSFAAFPASKPYYRAWDGSPVIPMALGWFYMTSGRSLRGAVHLTETGNSYGETLWIGTYNYPRATHWAFRASDPAPTPTEYMVGAVNAPVETTSGIQGKSGVLTAMLGKRYAGTTSDACNVYLVSHAFGDQILTRTDSYLPDILQQAHGNEATIFASSNPSQFNSRTVAPGAQYVPRNPIVTHPAVGATPAAGTYLYVVVREWLDSAGNVYRSAPSDPVSITTGTPGSNQVDVYDDPWENLLGIEGFGFNGSILKVYRTTNNGTVFYNISGVDGVFRPTAMGSTAVSDTISDAALVSGEILYTQGERGGNSGMLEWWGPPPCRSLGAGPDRMIAGGLENEHRVQLSNLYFEGEQVSWPQNEAFFITFEGIVIAVAALDTYYLAFCTDGIYLITGQGPDSFGVGTFDTPRKIAERQTAHSWRSVVETPEGIMFQAEDGQIYLIQRGTFQVQLKSQGIHDSVGRAASTNASPAVGTNDVRDPTNWVVGAVYDAFENEVRFVQRTSNTWVYQLEYGAWREEVSTAETGGLAIGSWITVVVSAGTNVAARFPSAIRVSAGVPTGFRVARRSDTGTYSDHAGGYRYMTVESNDIDMVHGRVKRLWVRIARGVDEATPAIVPSKISVWYDGKFRGQAADDTGTFTPTGSESLSNFIDLEHCPSRQKCNQFRFAWSDNPSTAGALNLSAHVFSLEVEYEPSASGRGSIRYAAGSGRMT